MNSKTKISTLIIILILPFIGHAKNLGHRAGGGPKEYWKTAPENSLKALKYSLIGNSRREASQNSEDFLYLEFDVQETYDNVLVVFHDELLARMIPYEGINKKAYREITKSKAFRNRVPVWERRRKLLKIKNFTYKELKKFRLKGSIDQYIPTLREFIQLSEKLKLRKPMAIEIKNIRTKKAKEKLIDITSQFHENYMEKSDIRFSPKYDMPFKVSFLAFPHVLYKTFGYWKKSRDYWCKKIIAKNLFGVFKPKKHNNQCLE